MRIPNNLFRHSIACNFKRNNLFPRMTVDSTVRSFSSTGGYDVRNSQSTTSTSTSASEKEAQGVELPKLPVPKLQDTLGKLLRSVKPLVTPEEFETNNKLAHEFASDGSIGPTLQALLEQRSEKVDNWLSDWWLSAAYLEFRSPVIVHSSPGLVFPLEEFEGLEDQLRYASKLIYGALCYKHMIDKGLMKPDMMGKYPLDMSQYSKVLGTNRRPGLPSDELHYNPNSLHIVVAYKNYFFKTRVYADDGSILNPTELYSQLKFIVNQTSGLSGAPVGMLTSDHRDTWAAVYPELIKDPQNANSVQNIEKSLFLVAIDRPNRPLKSPKKGVDAQGVEDESLSDQQTVAAIQMIHGNRTNSGNRWFDKTIQFIVGSEGECGLTYEHSPAEGPPIANLMDFIVNNLPKFESLLKVQADESVVPVILPERLPFNISDKLSKSITDSKQALGLQVDDLDMACFTFQKYGKDFIKTCQLSPDSYVQMAIQAAFYRIHQIPGAQYESASTRMYVGGRTETIRSCSIESLEFSKALINNSLSAQEKFQAMKRAVEGHKRYAADAVRGFGIDRHLLGLKLIAKANKIKLPEFFQDPGLVKSSHFRISTSQVASVNQAFMCYGPLVPNGYGCCYNPRKNDISFGISAFNSSKETNAAQFKIALQQCLIDMQNVASKSIPSKL